MTNFAVSVIADSYSVRHPRITTVQLCYPRFIHSELMTHRVFSRNASSSRAIPVAKMIEQVRNNPAMPVHWGKNQPGMQAREELEGMDLVRAKARWLLAAESAANHAHVLAEIGAHKQVINRILEPFQWMHTIVTSTQWSNFFDLRTHKDAEPNIQHLANMLKAAMAASEPQELSTGKWHIPYVKQLKHPGGKQVFVRGDDVLSLEDALITSAARCARVSYLSHDGKETTIEQDRELFTKLVVRSHDSTDPIHASPTEHQACADEYGADYLNKDMHRNFYGWNQFRAYIEKGVSVS